MRTIKIFGFILLSSMSYLTQAFSYQNKWETNTVNTIDFPEFEVFSKGNQPSKIRTLLVTGCARSGTGFISAFLKANQLDVGHELDAPFGIVAWTMAPYTHISPWGPISKDYWFEHIFHQVRHPLKTIASAGNEPPISWNFIRNFVPEIQMNDPKIVKGAKYWFWWNLIAEQRAEWTYRIEDIENQVEEMSARLGVDLDPTLLQNIPTNTNTRWYPDVYTWEDLKQAVSEDLYYNIIDMAIRYGYEIDDL